MNTIKLLTIFAFCAAATSAAAAQPRIRIDEGREVLDLDRLPALRPRVKGESVQGMAICNGHMFVLYHGGACAVINLENSAVEGEFTVEAAAGTHCNNVSFGVEFAEEGSRFPLLYISECNAPSRCFVTDISAEGASSIATIRYAGSGIAEFCDWCVDRENRHLYAYGKTPQGGAVLKRFALPTLAEMRAARGDVVLGDSDVLWQCVYDSGFFRIPQGSCIRNGYIYLPTGVPRVCSCHIHIVDLSSGERVERIDIDGIRLEPEGICPVGEEIMLMFGSSGSSGRLRAFEIGPGSYADQKL